VSASCTSGAAGRPRRGPAKSGFQRVLVEPRDRQIRSAFHHAVRMAADTPGACTLGAHVSRELTIGEIFKSSSASSAKPGTGLARLSMTSTGGPRSATASASSEMWPSVLEQASELADRSAAEPDPVSRQHFEHEAARCPGWRTSPARARMIAAAAARTGSVRRRSAARSAPIRALSGTSYYHDYKALISLDFIPRRGDLLGTSGRV
jgi:hypothetical protein